MQAQEFSDTLIFYKFCVYIYIYIYIIGEPTKDAAFGESPLSHENKPKSISIKGI